MAGEAVDVADVARVVAAVEAAYVAHGRGGALELGAWDAVAVAGAAGAISSKFLAVGTPRSMGFIGCGAVAAAMLAAHRVVFAAAAPRELRCAGDDAAAFAAAHGGRVTSAEEACACDIVCIAQAGAPPGLPRAWFRGGTHVIVAEGAGVIGGEVRAASKRVDDRVASAGAWGTLGEVAAGIKDGRELDELTLYERG